MYPIFCKFITSKSIAYHIWDQSQQFPIYFQFYHCQNKMSKCNIFDTLNLLSKGIKIKPDLPFERLNSVMLQLTALVGI